MRLLSIYELKRLSRCELHALLDSARRALDEFPEESFEYENTLTNYRNVRWVLANFNAVTRDFAPR